MAKSLAVATRASSRSSFCWMLGPALTSARVGEPVPFERLGYFATDPDSRPGSPVFNRTVTLKDAWARIAKKQIVERSL